jgi:hypothetical protein
MPDGRDGETAHPTPPFSPEPASDPLSAVSLASRVPGAAPLEPLDALPPELASLAPLLDPELALALPPELLEVAPELVPAPELEPVLELPEPLDPDVAPLEPFDPLDPDVAPLEPLDPDVPPLELPPDEPEPASQHAA